MLRRLVTMPGVAVLGVTTASAQQAGQIIGVVTDSSGAAVPGAVVNAVEVGTAFARSAITGSAGESVLPAPQPTQYGLVAELRAFRSFHRDLIACSAPCNQILRDPLGGVFPNNQIPLSRVDPAAIKVNSSPPAAGGMGLQSLLGRSTGNGETREFRITARRGLQPLGRAVGLRLAELREGLR